MKVRLFDFQASDVPTLALSPGRVVAIVVGAISVVLGGLARGRTPRC